MQAKTDEKPHKIRLFILIFCIYLKLGAILNGSSHTAASAAVLVLISDTGHDEETLKSSAFNDVRKLWIWHFHKFQNHINYGNISYSR